MRHAIVAIALAASLLAMPAQGAAKERKAGLPEPGSVYVALGSSFASGPGTGEIKPDTPARCTRSFANYATLLAERLRLVLIDATCGGATTEHVLGRWNELPAQIDAVAPETRLVTVTIGGNDIGYVASLMAASCGPDGTMTYNGQSFPCPKAREPGEEDYARLESSLARIAAAVKVRAPRARLVFVQYLRLVPDRLCGATPLTDEGAAMARRIARRLADATAKVAKANGAVLVPMHELSASHTACSTSPWTIGKPDKIDASLRGIAWHPNDKGMVAVARALEKALAK